MTDVLIRPADLRKAATRYESARERLVDLSSLVGGPVPAMPADLRQAAIAVGIRSRADLKQQGQYLGEEARDLRRRAQLADQLDAGLPPALAASLVGLTQFSGTVRRLSRVFTMPKAPTTGPKYNWMQKAGRFSFSLGAGALDGVSFGAFGKVVHAAGLDEVYDRHGLASKLGEYGSYALGVSAVVKHGAERVAARSVVKRGEIGVKGGGSIRDVNPGYPAAGRTGNCVRCAVATDSRLRGAPASALPGEPMSVAALERHYGGSFTKSTVTDIQRQLKEAGPRSSGIVVGTRPNGAVGHAFNAENHKGIVRFLDGQVGRRASLDGFDNFYFLRTK